MRLFPPGLLVGFFLFFHAFSGWAATEVDLDSPGAETALSEACRAKDFYACTRLGQFYEVKQGDLKKALPFYDRACAAKEKYGCDGSYEALMNLCYLKKEKKFCGKKDPRGEYRILAFLQTLDPKYQDAFVSWNFDQRFAHRETEAIYQKRIRERNKKLLQALELAQKKGLHDAADGEALMSDIARVKGDKERMKELEGAGL